MLLLQLEVLTKEICFSCWQSQVLFKELDLFFFPCFVPKLPQLADLVQTMTIRVSNTAQDAALVLCLRENLSSSLGGGAFKGDRSTDPDFLVTHYENFLQQLFSLTLRPSAKQLVRTVLKAHDGIERNDANEWAKKICFLTTYIRSKGYRMSTGARTEPSVVRLSQILQTSESGSAVTLPLQKSVLWKGASKLKSPQKQKAKTPQKEKAVAGSQKRMTISAEGAAASKRQNILAAWGAENVERSQESDQFVDVVSSEESQKDAEKTEDIASSFFDQHQCSMVVVDTKGCHHVCTTSAGEHGFLEFSFQGLQRTTEIPNLALESVQDSAFKRPASVAKSVAKKPATQAKSGAKAKSSGSKGNSVKEPSPAEIVSASGPRGTKLKRLTISSCTSMGSPESGSPPPMRVRAELRICANESVQVSLSPTSSKVGWSSITRISPSTAGLRHASMRTCPSDW